ncbi:50S ribosomal protein L11 methyltransferase [Phosphitispora fastidiosa]|uniref:50S ribosomal protein L11 methyltransferase n=1 Tax=Phosphitispora fastidiosa TaxID=2837202 RepID=UPI001E2BDCCD|nr:50S ribosomal protein L11 methyltransferase [Phosphitispora fastidiosa]MBU7005904.1 ribosomal protein L11 methyltransferase [Phosphitispora fastidiosa]
MDWREIAIETEPDAVEAVSAILIDCGAGGVSIEDPYLVKRQIAEKIWDAYEFPQDMLNRESVLVKSYLSVDSRLEERVGRIRERLRQLDSDFFPGAIRGMGFSQVQEEDWANSWKAYYKPVNIGRRIVIKPTWEDYHQKPGELVIALDPGMAFGTGTHPTTVMCIRFLEDIIQGGETVLDIGTGSGILSIAAGLLGAGEVWAVDFDPVAVTVAAENVTLNGLEDKIKVMEGNLLDGVTGQADILTANIVADVIIRICPDANRVLKNGGVFVASGIIGTRSEEVFEAARGAGFVIKEVSREGEWVSFRAVRED